MKTRFTNLLMVVGLTLATTFSFAQNLVQNAGLETWTDVNTPADWDKAENITQETTIFHGGANSARHESASGTKDLQQNVTGVTAGKQYEISYWYLDNDNQARSRIWAYWLSGTTTLPDHEEILRPADIYSEDNAEWIQFNQTLVAPAGADGFRFEVRIYKQDDLTGGYVYYDDFNVAEVVTNNPEPDNYPTAFAATANGLVAELAWTDATGTNLPQGYVIMASETNSFTAPVDGTPVVDDLDMSDGEGAVNVSFGAQAYDFGGLDGNKTYYFTIYPYSNAGAQIDYKTDGTAPATSVLTSNIVVLNQEGFDVDLGTWTQISVTGDDQTWHQASYSGQTYAMVSGYANNVNNVNEDWLISPSLDLTVNDNEKMTFRNATKFDGPALELLYSTDYSTGDPNGATWTALSATWSGGNWEWVASGDVKLNTIEGANVHIAFKYTSTDAAAATWEIDEIMIADFGDVGIEDNGLNQFVAYPNPATDVVNMTFATPAARTITIYNLMGAQVRSLETNNTNVQLGVNNLTRGLYMVSVTANGVAAYTTKLVVK